MEKINHCGDVIVVRMLRTRKIEFVDIHVAVEKKIEDAVINLIVVTNVQIGHKNKLSNFHFLQLSWQF